MHKLIKKIRSKEFITISLILLLAFGIRFIPFSQEFAGFDTFVHYSVVEQALNNNELPNSNLLDSCPNGIPNINHPIGFYMTPYILGKFMDLKLAFSLSSVLFGVITILLVYILFRKVFNKKIATIGVLFLSICFAHISRSHATFYRGENFVFPFLLLSLIFGLKFLTAKNKLLFASLAGLFSGLSVLFWPGYPFVLIVYMISVILFIIHDFIKDNEIKNNIYYASYSFILQFLLVRLLSRIFFIPEHTFVRLPYILLTLSSIGLLFASFILFNRYIKKGIRQKTYFLVAITTIILIIALIKRQTIMQLTSGFGLIRPELSLYKNILELQPVTISALFSYFWIIPLISLAGVLIMLYKPDNKRIFLTGSAIISIYLLSTTLRFLFLGGIIFIPFIGVVFGSLKNINKKITYSILAILLILTGLHALSTTLTISSNVHQDMITGYDYFNENTDENSCLLTIPDWGGMTQYYAKRSSYISSTNHDLQRFNELNSLFFTNKRFDININNAYVGIMPDDFKKIHSLISLTDIDGLYSEQLYLEDKKDNDVINENVYHSSNNREYTASLFQDNIIVKRMENNNPIFIRTVFLEMDGTVHKMTNDNAQDDGCIYLSNYVTAYFNNKLCETNIIKILTQQEIYGLEEWYSYNNVRFYKLN